MARRAKNIFKRKDGRYEGRCIKDRTPEGKAVYGFVYAKTYADVKVKLEKMQLLYSKHTGRIVSDLDTSLAILLREFELRNFAESTQDMYFRAVRKFVSATSRQNNLQKLTIDDVKNYIHDQHYTLGISEKTCNIYITAIKYLFTLALQKEWDNDMFPRFRLPKRLPVVLSKDAVSRLVNAINDKMHRMIAILMYSSGLRVSEAVCLRISDIRRETKQIFISQGKGRKDRYAILSDRCLKELEIYWREFRPSNYFFPSKQRGYDHVNIRTIQEAIRNAAQKIGLTENVTSHTLRHCFATHMIEANVGLFHTMEAMGHTSIKTTQKYVHLASLDRLNVTSPYDL
jgi:site-specific recombinase XerD